MIEKFPNKAQKESFRVSRGAWDFLSAVPPLLPASTNMEYMREITFTEDCLIGASNFILEFACYHPGVLLIIRISLYVAMLGTSVVLIKKKGWKIGLAFLVGGIALIQLLGILIIKLIW